MIDATTLEQKTEIERRHKKLREMARAQGVKPIKKIQDLYVETEEFDVDEFLATVRELRNDSLK